MSQLCPDCQRPLAQFSVRCDHCGWNLVAANRDARDASAAPDELRTGFDLHYQAACDAIERQNYETALLSISRALVNANAQQRSDALALRGYTRLKQHDWSGAEQDCTLAIDSGWAESRTYAWRAAARCGLKNYPPGFDDFAKALELAGPESDHLQPMVQTFLQQARDHYGQLLQDAPDVSDHYWARGWVYLRALILDKAGRDFSSALHKQPAHPGATVGLALVRLESGEAEQAIKLVGPIIAAEHPVWLREALYCRARAWAEVDGAEACWEDLDRLLAMAGNDSLAILALAQTKFDLGLAVAAISDCDQILKLNGELVSARLLRGAALAKIGNHAAALRDLSSFVHAFPASIIGLIERGKTLVALGEPQRALQDFERVLELQPRHAPAELGRARAWLLQQRSEEALAAVDRALEWDETLAEGLEIRGQIHVAGRDFQAAVDDFSKAIEATRVPEQKANGFFLRGTTLYELGQFDLARSDFETASILRPSHAGAWIWLAAVDARQEQWTSAISSLQRAILVRPQAAKQYLQLGRPVAERAVTYFTQQIQRGQTAVALRRDRGLAYQFLGELAPAIADFEHVKAETPSDLETRVRLGQLYQKQGNHPAAIAEFTYVIHRDKVHHVVRYHRALSAFLAGQPSQAHSDILKAISLDPRQAKYHVLRGEMVQREGRWKRAVRCFDRAIALDPQDPTPRRLKGTALAELQAPQLALAEFKRAIEMSPEVAENYIARGQFYLRGQEWILACTDFDRAIVCQPDALKAYLGRSQCLLAQGRLQETLIWLTKSLHRFPEPRPLAEILMKRGRAFYQMGLSAFAVNDFSSALQLLRKLDVRGTAQARFARGLAWIQAGQIEQAKHDLIKLIQRHPEKFPGLPAILTWLSDRSGPPPAGVHQPLKLEKIAKPKIQSGPQKRKYDDRQWEIAPPFDTWIVRDQEREFGPVTKATLNRWFEQGRLTRGMKLTRGDWSRWRAVEKIFRELQEPPAN